MLGISDWLPYLGVVIPFLIIAIWWLFNKVASNQAANDKKREEIVEKYEDKLQLQADRITEVVTDLAVNKTKDEQTYHALIQLGGQIEKSNAAIHKRLDKIDTDLREIFKNQKS